MPTSKLQEEVKNQLRVLLKDYSFVENYRPSWLRNPETRYRLELDFWLPELGIAIEVQGSHHYEYTPHFHGTIEEFDKQAQRDQLKRDVCQSRGVHLYEISTKADIDLFIEKARRHSKKLGDDLHRRNTAFQHLGYYAAELVRESGKKKPDTQIQDKLARKIASIANEYEIPLKEVKPDFTITKMQMGFPGKPIVHLKAIHEDGKTVISLKAAILSHSMTEVILAWYGSRGKEFRVSFDPMTGVQISDEVPRLTIKPEHISRINDAIWGVRR